MGGMVKEEPHPFVTAMVDFLLESGHRASRLSLVQAVMTSATAKYEQDIKIMSDLANESECRVVIGAASSQF